MGLNSPRPRVGAAEATILVVKSTPGQRILIASPLDIIARQPERMESK